MKAKNLNDLIEKLRGETKILVTGPCRSGTTICCHILERELGLTFIDSHSNYEDSAKSIGYVPTFGTFLNFSKHCHNFIAHGPHFHPFLHQVPKDVMIVFMRRPIEDVMASTKRIFKGKWNSKWYDKRSRLGVPFGLKGYFDKLNYAQKTYWVWDNFQKMNINKYIEVSYNILKQHELFIPKRQRKKFRERQWQAQTALVKC